MFCCPLPLNIFAQKLVQGCCKYCKVPNKFGVIISQSKKSLQLFFGYWHWPIQDGINLLWFHCDGALLDDMSKV